MRPGYVWAVLVKEGRDLLANRLLLAAVVFPAVIFAAIPTGIVAIIQVNDLDPSQLGQIEQYIGQFPGLEPKLAAGLEHTEGNVLGACRIAGSARGSGHGGSAPTEALIG